MEQRYETREVVVAATDVRRGEFLGSTNLAVRSIPRDYIPADAITADRAGTLMGNRLAVPVSRGTPLTAGVIAASVAEGLSAALAASERAVTLAVDSLNSQANALRTGDFVDLYYGRRDGSDELLVPLMQRVEILAVGESFTGNAGDDDAPRNYATVTLRMPAAQAPRVLLAQQAGEVSVLLRARSDQAALPDQTWRGRDLLRAGPERSAPHAGIEVLTGGKGAQVPERTWLRVSAAATGEAT